MSLLREWWINYLGAFAFLTCNSSYYCSAS